MTRLRFIAYFFAVFLPIALVLSLLINWHNSVVGEPTGMHLIIMAIVAIVLFLIGGIVFAALVVARKI